MIHDAILSRLIVEMIRSCIWSCLNLFCQVGATGGRARNRKGCVVKQLLISSLLVLAVTGTMMAQSGKGVDKQQERVSDNGSNKTAGVNGSKTNTGTGRGFDFGKGRTAPIPMLPNPYRLS